MKNIRNLVLLLPLAIFILSETTFYYSKFFPFALILGNFFILFTLSKFAKNEDRRIELTFYSAITPTLFFSSLFLYASLSSIKPIVQFLFFGQVFFLYHYLKQIYYFLNIPPASNLTVLKSFTIAANLLIVYFSGASAYWLQSFLNLPVWPLMSSLLLISVLISIKMAWLHKIKARESFIFILIIGLSILEVGWSVSFLPLNFNAAGLIIGIMYYVLNSLVFLFLKENLTQKTVKFYLFFGIISLLAILLTSRWM